MAMHCGGCGQVGFGCAKDEVLTLRRGGVPVNWVRCRRADQYSSVGGARSQ